MEDSLNIEKKAKNNPRAFIYTIIIFAIILFIWIKTNPLFHINKNTQITGIELSDQGSQKINSVGESFNTMWSQVLKSFQGFKK